VRQFRGEVRQWIADAEQLRQLLAGQKLDTRQLDEVLRGLRSMQDDRAYKDAAELLRLQAGVVENMKRFEFGLRRRAESAGSQPVLSGPTRCPSSSGSWSRSTTGRCRGPPAARADNAMRRASVAAVLIVLLATAVAAQDFFRGWGRRVPPRFPAADSFDGTFNFCRGLYTSDRREPGGQGWGTDYPDADINFTIRLSELTKTRVSLTPARAPNHLVVRLSDDDLMRCPFLFMSDVGTMRLSDDEVERLRAYLLKGGFIWVDDFWGEWAWAQWVEEIHRVLPPNEYPIRVVPPGSHRVSPVLPGAEAAADPLDRVLAAERRGHVRARVGERDSADVRHQ
jgi:hypothetical protein